MLPARRIPYTPCERPFLPFSGERRYAYDEMKRTSLSSPFIAVLLLATVILGTSGLPCSRSPGAVSMTGMSQPSQNAGGGPATTDCAMPKQDGGNSRNIPCTPEFCQAMISCSAVGIVSASSQKTSDFATEYRVVQFAALKPLSLTSAPEPPPPRA